MSYKVKRWTAKVTVWNDLIPDSQGHMGGTGTYLVNTDIDTANLTGMDVDSILKMAFDAARFSGKRVEIQIQLKEAEE